MAIQSAFVTGATGLLGSNLVRLLAEQGVRVRALARSAAKAKQQLAGVPGVEIITGDMSAVEGFAPQLSGVDVLFHTAAYFRDSYKGGSHWPQLYAVNVEGTRKLLATAYQAGVRRMVYTSSIAVLDGPRGSAVHEGMLRPEASADDYYRSKILAEREVLRFLDEQPDFWAALVLPGWMHGPGDAGPTSAGQAVLDFVQRKLPGIVPGSAAFVDARDVAEAHWRALEKGQRGERYLAAGRHMSMAELFAVLEKVSGVPAPRRKLPVPLLYAVALAGEALARLAGKPALLSLAGVRLLLQEEGHSHFDHAKSERELGLRFRPVEQTLRDAIAWFANNGMLPAHTAARAGR